MKVKKVETLQVGTISFKSEQGYELFSIDISSRRISTDFDNCDISDEFDNFLSVINVTGTIFQIFEDTNIKVGGSNPFPSSYSKSLKYMMALVMKYFKDEFIETHFSHVSPVRAVPHRYYILEKANNITHLDTLDGTAIAQLLSNDVNLKKTVNKWLGKFNISIDVPKMKEVIYKMTVTSTSKSDTNPFSLDLSDVGFGISQMLPIIVQGFFSKNNNLMVVEQPEVHLHPQMQAELADMFIEMLNVGERRKTYIIETHSEYMLKRLRRRMREHLAKGEKAIDPECVSICLFKKKTEDVVTEVQSLDIEKDGRFPWPEDFFMGPLLEDTLSL